MQGIPPDLFSRLIETESGWNPDAVSSAGAEGIAQFMPLTSQGNVDPFNPFESLSYAAELLRSYYRKFGDWEQALAAYNAGPGAVQKYGGVPPYTETQNYIRKILGKFSGDSTGTTGSEERGSIVQGTAWKIVIWSAAAVLLVYGFRAVLK